MKELSPSAVILYSPGVEQSVRRCASMVRRQAYRLSLEGGKRLGGKPIARRASASAYCPMQARTSSFIFCRHAKRQQMGDKKIQFFIAHKNHRTRFYGIIRPALRVVSGDAGPPCCQALCRWSITARDPLSVSPVKTIVETAAIVFVKFIMVIPEFTVPHRLLHVPTIATVHSVQARNLREPVLSFPDTVHLD
jgi:hypothetical protein